MGNGVLTADIVVTRGGSLVILYPLTDYASGWLDDNLQECPMLGNGYVIEWRYAGPIIAGALREGPTVQAGWNGKYFQLREEEATH